MRRILIIFITLFLNSCSSEFIELRSRNYLKIYDNDKRIKIIPRKNSLVVKAHYHNTILEKQNPYALLIKSNKKIKSKKKIPKNDYDKIKQSFENIDEELMKFPKKMTDSTGFFPVFVLHETASNTITYKKGNFKKTIYGKGMIPDDGYFYITSKMIIEKAGFKIEDFNR